MRKKREHLVATVGVLGEPRGRLLVELCGHPRTAGELATRVGTSSNAVRVHLDALRTTGLVEYRVERRGVGKPRHVFSLTAAAEYLVSRAYAPVLRAVVATMRSKLAGGLSEWLRECGVALAQQAQHAERRGVDAALSMLQELGAVP